MGQVDIIIAIVLALLGIAVGAAIGVYFGTQRGRLRLLAEQDEAGANRRKMAEEEAPMIFSEADKRGKALEIKARDDTLKLTLDTEDSIKKRPLQVNKEAERVDPGREHLRKRYERI